VKLLYFAWVREKVGASEEDCSPPTSVQTVADLMDWLSSQSPGHAAAFANRTLIKVAVDQVHAPATSPLGSADEVAFFPPMTGG
jgi:sulfur-carrier protein